VGNLVWGLDGGVWAVWRVEPFPHAHTSAAHKLAVHSRLHGMLLSAPADSMLLSVCERLGPYDVVANMLEGVDISVHDRWADVCARTADVLADRPLHRRRYYLAAALPAGGRGWLDAVHAGIADVTGLFGLPPSRVAPTEQERRARQARDLEASLRSHLSMERITAGELRWLYARALRRGIGEPPLDESWEPAGGSGTAGVLAPLTDAIAWEGGGPDDIDRPHHRRYVRVDTVAGSSFQTVLAIADMPHRFVFPGGGGEWLFHVDDLDFPIDWCLRIHAVSNADAQAKTRRQHRQLVGQVDEYEGEVTGAPPSLADAIGAIDAQRAELASSPAEPELQVTIVFGLAAASLGALEQQAAAVSALFEPHEYGTGRPTGGQLALLRSMLPGTAAATVCRDYTQFLMARDLAAGAPFCGPQVGDPKGLFLGLSLDAGTPSPVLLDPTFGPSVGRTASLGAVGALGSGKSYFLKRLCWDTIARGGQVVTIDRTTIGEYANVAKVAPGRAQVVQLGRDVGTCLDPLRTFGGDERVAVALGFLSLLAGCSAHSEEGAALAEAVHAVADDRTDGRLSDVVDELRRMGDDTSRADPAARSLARRLDHYRRLAAGQIAFGTGEGLELDADLIVFWAPNLALPDRDTLLNEHLSRQMLPEQVLGQALLYLVAAVGRHVVFRDPSRFGAALYDEAWALLASPHGQRLVLEGIRDGRKHNGAIWLASQHPNDLGIGEVVDLLGTRLVFRQAHGAIAAALDFLGVTGSEEAHAVLDRGLAAGQCLFRDVRDRIGLVQILEPVVPGLVEAFDTTPRSVAPAAQPPPGVRPSDVARAQARGRRRTPLSTLLERDTA
jgi:hypothetical protein